jgi:hypothetical protein
MTDSETKDVQPHPSAADCVCINEGAERHLDKARIAASRTILAVDRLRGSDPCKRPSSNRWSISPSDSAIRDLAINWTVDNRPNLEMTYSMPDESNPGSVLRYEVSLPEGSIHLAKRMDLDLAGEIGVFMGEAGKQALDRGWAPPREDEADMRSWALGVREIVLERIVTSPIGTRFRDDVDDVHSVFLPTPWSPIMVRLLTSSKAIVPAAPLSDMHAGDPLLDAVERSAPMAVEMNGGGDHRRRSIYVTGYHADASGDVSEMMRCIAHVQERSR